MQCQAVVIVDDDREIRTTLQELLELESYEVYGAENGKEGFDLLHRIECPCLILLGFMMPVQPFEPKIILKMVKRYYKLSTQRRIDQL